MADRLATQSRGQRATEGGSTSPEGVELSVQAHDFLKALANPTRQRVMLLFARGAELSVGEIAERAAISQSTASQHLSLLHRGGIVTSRRDGKVVYYRADRKGTAAVLTELQAYLTVCC